MDAQIDFAMREMRAITKPRQRRGQDFVASSAEESRDPPPAPPAVPPAMNQHEGRHPSPRAWKRGLELIRGKRVHPRPKKPELIRQNFPRRHRRTHNEIADAGRDEREIGRDTEQRSVQDTWLAGGVGEASATSTPSHSSSIVPLHLIAAARRQ